MSPPKLPDPPERKALRVNPELAALHALMHQAHIAIEALAAVYLAEKRDPVLLQQSRVVAEHAQALLLAVEAYRRIIVAAPCVDPQH